MNQQLLKQGSYTRTNGAQADNIWPEFFVDTIPDPLETERNGFQCYKNEERVRLHFPGDQTKKPVFKVTREYTERWPREYEAFKAGIEISPDGTPLELWPVLNKAQVLTLKAQGFRTVEDIADMSDLAAQKIMAGARMKLLAQTYIDDSRQQAEIAKTTAENDKLRLEIRELSDKVAAQAQMMEALSSKLLAIQNAPHPIATHIPGMHDPIEAARQAAGVAAMHEVPTQSVLDSLPAPRRRGKQSAETAA